MNATSERELCPRCGAEIPQQAPFGQCPHCLLHLGFSPEGGAFTSPHERFGDYELIRQVGRGAMGVVYEAVQLKLRRRVALKMILDSQASSPAVRRRFAIEAEAVAKLDHPNILPIYEVGEWEEQPFLGMKRVEGASLRQKMTQGELGLFRKDGGADGATPMERAKAAARLVATIAKAVHHAHEHGVLHRDLKPGNVLIDAEGRPYLTDFGLAKLMDGAGLDHGLPTGTVPGSILGTPSYMSPEAAGGRRLSAVSDVYSLGAILYELLTGQPPFKAASAIETMRLVVEQDPRRPKALHRQIPRDLDTICMKCLEKNPGARYQSAGDLAEDLERWLEQRPIHARPAGPMLRLGRWTRRNPVGAALILTLCCSLSGALVLWHRASVASKQAKVKQAALLTIFCTQIEELWNDPSRSNVTLSSSQLAAIGNYSDRSIIPGNKLRLTFSQSLGSAPVTKAMAYAPVLHLLEDKMQELLNRPVVFGLSFYKSKGGVDSPVVTRAVDFQRIGFMDYLRAKQAQAGIELVAQERTHRQGVIFARRGSGIQRLSDVIDRRVAFAHVNSEISALAMRLLANAGVARTNLARCERLMTAYPPVSLGVDSGSESMEGRDSDWEYYAHKAVINAVLANEFDVGEAPLHYFQHFRHRGLVELTNFDVPPDVYAAKPGLAPEVVSAFRQSLLSLHTESEKRLLKKLHSVRLEGFDPVSDADLSQLWKDLTNALTLFEPAAATSSP